MSKRSSKKGKVAATNGGFRWAHCAVFAAVCALVIGFYAWGANSGVLELMGSGAKDSYYNLQVQAFQDGHLNLERQVPPEYGDPPRFTWDGNYGLDDLSYYNGKLYLYFGVTPALVLFWPYAALTGHYLLHKDAAVFFFSAGFLAGAGLLWAIWRRYFKECGVWVAAAGVLALGLGNFAPAILGRCDVYEVAVSCGYALTMLALCGIWRALHDTQHRWRWLAAASLAYGLAVGARPSLLLGAVILLVPVIQAWREKGRVWPLLAAACGPIMAVGLGLAIYNAQRFDNPLEFGQRYQLPLAEHQQFNWRYLWFNIRVGFLEPARWSGDFPFVDNIAAPKQPAGYWQVVDAFGVLTNIPLVWLALALPLGWRSRPEEERARFRLLLGAVAALFAMSALPLLFHDSMCLRYELEYASPLVLLAVVGVFGLERAPAARPVWRRAVRCGWGALLALTLAFNLLASYKMNADDHQNFGPALFNSGRVDEAIVQYQKTLQMRPGNEVVHNNLGNALLQKGRLDDAITQYQEALQLIPAAAAALKNPGSLPAQDGAKMDKEERHSIGIVLKNLGNVLLQEGKVDDARTHYQQAVQIEPTDWEARLRLGRAFLEKGQANEAIAQFQVALQLKPDSDMTLNNLGYALWQAGRRDEAIPQFQKSLQINPNNALVQDSLGHALLEQGRAGEAIPILEMALELKPDLATARNNLGVSLMQKGRVDEAIEQFQKILLNNPNLAETHDNLGNALLQKGKLDEAISQYEQALQISPDNALVLGNLGAVLVQKGKLEEGIARLQKALQLKPDEETARMNLGDAYLQEGALAQAIPQYEQALRLKPADPAIKNTLAWLLATVPEASLRDGSKAVELALQANKETGGENPVALHTLGAAYAEAGKFAEAVEAAQHALRLAQAHTNTVLVNALESELKLYQAGTPFHRPQAEH